MTDPRPPIRPQGKPEYVLQATGINPSTGGGVAVPQAAPGIDATELTYEHGVEVKARSQWAYARMRFFRHKLAVVSLVHPDRHSASSASSLRRSRPTASTSSTSTTSTASPTLSGLHLFGTDQLGRDYLSRVIYGIRTSLWVAILVALLSTFIGTVVGSIAGYYGGKTDNLLMRFTDLILTLPGLAVLLTPPRSSGSRTSTLRPRRHDSDDPPAAHHRSDPRLPLLDGPRADRPRPLPLAPREGVRRGGEGRRRERPRIIVRHILPNCVGPIVVNMTLVIAAAILTEAALSFLGFGIQPPQAGARQADRRRTRGGLHLWWLVHVPGARDRRHRRSASTSSATGCATRSIRRSGGCVPELGRSAPLRSSSRSSAQSIPLASCHDRADPLHHGPHGRVRPRTESSHAVTDVSYDLFPGEMLGVIGESGSGKSVIVDVGPRSDPESPADRERQQALYKGPRSAELSKEELQDDPRGRDRDDLPGPDDRR